MAKRIAAIWFRHLKADWMTRRRPEIKDIPFVLAAPERGRMIVRAVNSHAQAKGVYPGMVVADCRAILPSLQVFDDTDGLATKLLTSLAEWLIRYTPIAAIDLPDGIILDITGCAHLWGGEEPYLKDILTRLEGFGYCVKAAIADTIGTAWAVSRYGQFPIVEPHGQAGALRTLPPAALRLETPVTQRLEKLGLYRIQNFITMPRSALRRRFGDQILIRLGQALGTEPEEITPVIPIELLQERLPSLEPIRTAKGIEIALTKLLETLCARLTQEGKGLRHCVFKCYRIDGRLEQIEINTSRASRNPGHLFKLFAVKIVRIEPDLGIELFALAAPVLEDMTAEQEALWELSSSGDEAAVAELLDRIAGKVGAKAISRYLPVEHHWPERSIQSVPSLEIQPQTNWRASLPRPMNLLAKPEEINVTVPIPDYPPMLFHYKGKLHKVAKADGPERIEQEWWEVQGQYRDYYCVEDESGARFWLFRLGHYYEGEPKWYMHGFFV